MPAPTALRPTATHQFTGRDVRWLLRTRVEKNPRKTFLAWEPFTGEPQVWSYQEFLSEVEKTARGLLANGVREGDFVVIHLGNCPEFLLTWFGLSFIGAIAVTTNTRSSEDEMNYFIDHCGADVVVTQPEYVSMIRSAAPQLRWIACTETDLGEPAEFPEDVIPFSKFQIEGDPLPDRPADAMAPNSVQYTSGTTSRPKGVLWTQANALWGARTMSRSMQLDDSDTTIAFLPLFHTNALCYSMLATLWSCGKLVVQPRFSASRYWEVATRHDVTWTSAIPFVMHALVPQPDPESHRVRFWGLGAAEIPTTMKRWGVRTIGWYGMTETVAACLISEQEHVNMIGSVGTPVPGYELKVVGEQGAEVPLGESGELKVRAIPGISIFYEYLNNPEATAESYDEEGWFDTGDIVTGLPDGSFRYEQRSKDMLKVGAENVAAAEIERVIATVDNVHEAAIVGKPDKMLDEVPVAFVILREAEAGADEKILAACRAALADFKVPREVRIVDELPRVTLEKVDKKTLRAKLKAELNEKKAP